MGHPNCQNCYFFCRATNTCDYWLIMDKLRGCPPGEGCTKKMTEKEYKRMSIASKWDKAAGREMWKAGKSDKEIAEFYGVSVSAVVQIRKKCWEKEAAPAEPENIPLPPPEPPAEVTAPVPAEETEEDDARVMIHALELITQNLQGMDAVVTAQIIARLWAWNSVDDLKDAREFLDYLIERAESK